MKCNERLHTSALPIKRNTVKRVQGMRVDSLISRGKEVYGEGAWNRDGGGG